MRRRSSIASRLPAIGRVSPCATTRAMCSSGAALSHTVQARRKQQVEGVGLGDDAAAGGDDAALVLLEHALQRAALVAPVARLTVQQEDLVQARAGFALDLAVELDEGHAELGARAPRPASTCPRRAGRSARCGSRVRRARLPTPAASRARTSASRAAGRRLSSSRISVSSTDWPSLRREQLVEREVERCAICRSSRIETLPRPASSCAR